MTIQKWFPHTQLRDPTWLSYIFGSTQMAPLWLFARAYLGYQWLLAGWGKVYGDDRWIAHEGEDGQQLKSFWERAVAIPAEGQPRIRYDWYRDFLNFMLEHEWYTWFSWVIAIGEVTVGLLLIVGLFTGIAALAGATLNFNFLLAGSASSNPVLFIIAVLTLFGWKVAGWIGLDRWVLPMLGTPWQPGAAVSAVAHRVEGPTERRGLGRFGETGGHA